VQAATNSGTGVQPPEKAESREPAPLVTNIHENFFISQLVGSAQRVARKAEQPETTFIAAGNNMVER
jgi:hypothetical protein